MSHVDSFLCMLLKLIDIKKRESQTFSSCVGADGFEPPTLCL